MRKKALKTSFSRGLRPRTPGSPPHTPLGPSLAPRNHKNTSVSNFPGITKKRQWRTPRGRISRYRFLLDTSYMRFDSQRFVEHFCAFSEKSCDKNIFLHKLLRYFYTPVHPPACNSSGSLRGVSQDPLSGPTTHNQNGSKPWPNDLKPHQMKDLATRNSKTLPRGPQNA